VLAVGSQVLGSRLRVPALIILLPAGFIAGAITDDVNPHKLLGPAFGQLVSLSVAVILYNAGLGLNLRAALATKQHVVRRLIVIGVPITWGFAALFAGLLLGLSTGAAVMIGAILVVSGPTVVDPLMRFVQPVERVRQVLSWEGSLIDPVGGVLGAVVFSAVVTHHAVSGRFLVTIVVGVAGAAIGVAVLWLCLVKLELGSALSTTSQLACIVGVAAVCDIVRDEAGLIAAILMGLAVANMPVFAKRERDTFFETLVQLLIGLLFVSISATVTPASLGHVVLPTVGLVAILVLVTRPLVAFISTLGSDLNRPQRMFIGWMAPRGIVAAATASTFATALIAAHVGGASKILPVTFLVIVMTVALYGLSAVPVAKKLGVRQVIEPFFLVVGGQPWVIDVARALGQSGVGVMMAAPSQDERDQITQAGLGLAPRGALADLLVGGAEIPEELGSMIGVLLLTREDGFNTLGSTVLAAHPRLPVYRLAPHPGGFGGTWAQYDNAATLFPNLTHDDITRRYQAGSRVTSRVGADALPDGNDVLFLIDRERHLMPVTTSHPPTPKGGDQVVVLGPAERNRPVSHGVPDPRSAGPNDHGAPTSSGRRRP
jgi:NhaP-type Na+/H+ or K+/H+ antiporter